MTSAASIIMSRWRSGSIPIMKASDGSWPGPMPSIARPMVMWSSCMMRSASTYGWWYESELTPVPSRIRVVRSAAAAIISSGEAMIS